MNESTTDANRKSQPSEKTAFIKYLVPSMLSMLAVSAYSFVDTFVVGQANGAQAVAAMGIGTPVVSILFALGFLCGAGGAVSYAVKMARGEKKIARGIFSTSFFAALVLWVVIAVCGNIWIEPLASFLGATEGNIAMAVEYLRWIISLSGILIMDLVMNNFMRNEGHPNVSMVATVSGTGLNIVLDFLFVMGFHWGMAGAASATCIASVISVSINLSYAIVKKTNLIPSLQAGMLKNVVSMVRLGLGSFVLEGAVAAISVFFLNNAGRYYGDAGVSAFSVLITLNLVCYSLINGVAQSVQPLISAGYGSGNKQGIKIYVRYGLETALVMGAVFTVLGEIFTTFFCGLFVEDSPETLELAVYGLKFYAPSFLFMAVSIIFGIYYQSIMKAGKSLIILLGRSLVLPVFVLYLSSLFLDKINVWVGVPAGELLAAVMAVIIYMKDRNSKAPKKSIPDLQ